MTSAELNTQGDARPSLTSLEAVLQEGSLARDPEILYERFFALWERFTECGDGAVPDDLKTDEATYRKELAETVLAWMKDVDIDKLSRLHEKYRAFPPESCMSAVRDAQGSYYADISTDRKLCLSIYMLNNTIRLFCPQALDSGERYCLGDEEGRVNVVISLEEVLMNIQIKGVSPLHLQMRLGLLVALEKVPYAHSLLKVERPGRLA